MLPFVGQGDQVGSISRETVARSWPLIWALRGKSRVFPGREDGKAFASIERSTINSREL